MMGALAQPEAGAGGDDREAARLHAPGEHHLRQPARGARRPRPAGQRVEAGRRPARARSSHNFRAAAHDAVPTITRPQTRSSAGRARQNDLIELTRDAVPAREGRRRHRLARLRQRTPPPTTSQAADNNFTQGALGESICALQNGLPSLSFFRPYTPELVGWFNDFGTSGVVDANGGIGRIGTTFNTFSVSGPIPGLPATPLHAARPADRRPSVRRSTAINAQRRCPGASSATPATARPRSPTAATSRPARRAAIPARCRPGHEADRRYTRRRARRRRRLVGHRASAGADDTPHLQDRDVQRVRARQRLRRADRRRQRRVRHRPRHQRQEARRRDRRAHGPARGARQGHHLRVRAAVADRRVLHRLLRPKGPPLPDGGDDPRQPRHRDGAARPRRRTRCASPTATASR